jgi:hypothetical protein
LTCAVASSASVVVAGLSTSAGLQFVVEAEAGSGRRLLIYADLFTGQKNLSLPLECSSHIMTVLQIILENRQQSCEIAFDRSPLDYWLSCGTRARPLYADSVDNIALGTSYPHSGIMFGYH